MKFKQFCNLILAEPDSIFYKHTFIHSTQHLGNVNKLEKILNVNFLANSCRLSGKHLKRLKQIKVWYADFIRLISHSTESQFSKTKTKDLI